MKTSETLIKTKWEIDPAHSEFGFKVKHLMITNIKGVFRDYKANIYTSGDDFTTSEIEVRINAASIDTGDEKRDTHLKSPDFFDAGTHPQIIFIGKKFDRVRDDNYMLYGDLAIREITIPVKLDVEFAGRMTDPYGNEKAGFLIEGKINRKEWELNWNTTLEAGGVLVGDEVKINCEIQLIKHSNQ